ncbi:MAG: hypothetical protein L0Z63_00550 [Actinobacteria bacterium]|nr:hypothetical protein [Actinomycetota bacterium]
MGGWGKALLALLAIVGLAGGLVLIAGDIPFTMRQQVYSIGVYRGEDLLDLDDRSDNPTLMRSDVGDEDAIGVADPWLVTAEDAWYLFFEVILSRPGAPNDQHGVIGLATSRDEGESWDYDGVVLEEDWHLSYPHVFSSDGEHYMVPETQQAGQVLLYRSVAFPHTWASSAVLLEGPFTDPTIFEHAGRWWLFVTESGDEPDDTLRLFFSEDLAGPYTEHPESPVIVGDISMARSAGPVVPGDAGPVRFAMDNSEGYGRAVRGFLITSLNTTVYEEEELPTSPVLSGSGVGWNGDGMHHYAPVRLPDGSWAAAVDGFYYERVFGFEY